MGLRKPDLLGYGTRVWTESQKTAAGICLGSHGAPLHLRQISGPRLAIHLMLSPCQQLIHMHPRIITDLMGFLHS